jgi:predicted lactoylglutathione lyase
VGRMIFPNFPVKDVPATVAFWRSLGFEFNEQFSSDEAACMVVNPMASVMLLQQDYFHGFHDTTPHTGTETLLCFSADTRAEVDDLCVRARAAGARDVRTREQGPAMYGGSFRDLDGHLWEVLWMDLDG